jgi:hypothetical protein
MAKCKISDQTHSCRTKPSFSRLTGPKTAIRAQNTEQAFGKKKPFESHFKPQEAGATCPRTPRTPPPSPVRHESQNRRKRETVVARQAANGSTTKEATNARKLPEQG